MDVRRFAASARPMIMAAVLFFLVPSAQAQDAPVKPVDRPQSTIGRPSGTTLPICEAAHKARERNSPAAPGLEKRCRESNAVKPAARVKLLDGANATSAQGALQTSLSDAQTSQTLQEQIARKTAGGGSVAVRPQARVRPSDVRKADLQRQIAEQNRRSKEIAAELAQNQDESAIGRIGNLIAGGDPQPSGVATAVQQQSPGGAARRVAPAFQSENTIAVRVRYLKGFGFKADTSVFGAAGPASCAVFSVSAATTDGSAPQRTPFPIRADSKLEDAGDYYACNYVVSQVPLDQLIAVHVAVSGPDLLSAWAGGGESQPPMGQQLTVVGAISTATLNASQPRAKLSYEMVYATVPTR